MFGIFRLIAALSVVLTHIGGIEFVAGMAVWGFFMLSGLLMTAALNSRYGLNSSGIFYFLASRALRLYPTYWLVILLTAGILFAYRGTIAPTLVNSALVFPVTLREWAANIGIIGQTMFGLGSVSASLSPAAWAVEVEIMMYLCSCLLLARSRQVATLSLGLLVSTFPVLWWLARGLVVQGEVATASQLLYSFLPAALLPYTIGTLLWFNRQWLQTRIAGVRWAALGVVGLLVAVLLVFPRSVTAAYLFSLPWLATLLCVLMGWRPKGALCKVDEFAGRMSYPIYLVHWICAYVAVLALPDSADWVTLSEGKYRFGTFGFLVTSGLAIVVSALFAVLVEAPVERLRHRLWRKREPSTT